MGIVKLSHPASRRREQHRTKVKRNRQQIDAYYRKGTYDHIRREMSRAWINSLEHNILYGTGEVEPKGVLTVPMSMHPMIGIDLSSQHDVIGGKSYD